MNGRPSVAVVGVGSIGAGIAAALHAADRCDLSVCTRRPLEHLNVQIGETHCSGLPRALSDPKRARPAQWVLLCTKAHEVPSTASWLARLCTSDTIVAVVQNGIDHVARVAPYANGATVLPALVYYNGEKFPDGRVRIRQTGNRDLTVAAGPLGERFAMLFDQTALRVTLSDDLITPAWRKLLINAIANPITALTLQRQGVLHSPEMRQLCLHILHEAVAAGRADGAQFTPDEAERTVEMIADFPQGLGTSMYFDRLAGRPLEVEALTGAIVAAGERHGVPMPLNRAMLALLRAISAAADQKAAPAGAPSP